MDKTENRNKIIGERVRAIRDRFGITQRELAEILGYGGDTPDRAVFMIEHGQRGLTAKKMQIIVDEYGINPQYLLLQSEHMTLDDLEKASFAKYDGVRDALETILKVTAYEAGFNLEYEKVNDNRLRYHFKNFKRTNLIPKGHEWIFTDDDINDYLQDIREYAVFKFEQMTRKKIPDSLKEGRTDNGKHSREKG